MRRIVCRAFGSPDMLELIDEPTPEVGPSDVLVEVETAGASFVDGLIVNGKYQIRPDLPFTPGSVFSGRVIERGPAPTRRRSVPGLRASTWISAATPHTPCTPRPRLSPFPMMSIWRWPPAQLRITRP